MTNQIAFVIFQNHLSHQYSISFPKMTELGICHFMKIFVGDKKIPHAIQKDKSFQIVPNGVIECFVNFQNVMENDKSWRYLELIFVR